MLRLETYPIQFKKRDAERFEQAQREISELINQVTSRRYRTGLRYVDEAVFAHSFAIASLQIRLFYAVRFVAKRLVLTAFCARKPIPDAIRFMQ